MQSADSFFPGNGKIYSGDYLMNTGVHTNYDFMQEYGSMVLELNEVK